MLTWYCVCLASGPGLVLAGFPEMDLAFHRVEQLWTRPALSLRPPAWVTDCACLYLRWFHGPFSPRAPAWSRQLAQVVEARRISVAVLSRRAPSKPLRALLTAALWKEKDAESSLSPGRQNFTASPLPDRGRLI